MRYDQTEAIGGAAKEQADEYGRPRGGVGPGARRVQQGAETHGR